MANNIQSTTNSKGIYIYVEYNWDNMSDGELPNNPFELTNEVFNSINDPRKSITNEKIADKTIGENKLSDELVEKINSSLYFYKMKIIPNFLNFNVSNLFNVLDYEGFNANPSVWKTSAGDGTAPIITIEEQENILWLKYARRFTVKDALYKGEYFKLPCFVLQLKSLVNVKTKSFCFFVNYKYL